MAIENSHQNGKLVIARHHESEWNKLGVWAGNRDVPLTEFGFQKSKEMGALIKDIRIDKAFSSTLIRTIQTLAEMLKGMSQKDVPTERSSAHNERDYGDYTGKNKWEMKKEVGEEVFKCIRRDWNCPVPNGETLKMVYDRALPFYLDSIVPLLRDGKNVLLVSHGNAIRALMKYIENIPEEDMKNVEMLFGAVVVYEVDDLGHMISKEVRGDPSRLSA